MKFDRRIKKKIQIKKRSWNLFIVTIISKTAGEMSMFFKNFIPYN